MLLTGLRDEFKFAQEKIGLTDKQIAKAVSSRKLRELLMSECVV